MIVVLGFYMIQDTNLDIIHSNIFFLDGLCNSGANCNPVVSKNLALLFANKKSMMRRLSPTFLCKFFL